MADEFYRGKLVTRRMVEDLVESFGWTFISYSRGRVSAQCLDGHEIVSTYNDLRRAEYGHECPRCVHNTIGSPARQRLREVMMERGWRIKEHEGRLMWRDIRGGWRFATQSNLLRLPPVIAADEGIPVRSWVLDDMVWYLMGLTPPIHLLPPLLRKVVEEGEEEIADPEDFGMSFPTETWRFRPIPVKKGDAYALMKRCIKQQARSRDMKLLNVWENPLWIAPGVYKWGRLAKPFAKENMIE